MSATHPCERVDSSYLATAPIRLSNSVDLEVTPEQLFEVLAEAESWPQWATVITKVTWTSPEPHGVGTTRVVDMRGGIVGHEEFLAWEPGEHMAFRFNGSSTGSLSAFIEDYRIEPTQGGCQLTWTLGIRLAGPARFTAFAAKPFMNMAFRRFLSNLRRYTDKRFAGARDR